MHILALALAFSSHALAADQDKQDKKADPPQVKVGALVFAHYGYDLTNR